MKNGLEIDVNGNKLWYLNNQIHREDGPAVEYANGSKYWYRNDQYHREDGPAVELSNGNKYWYLLGKLLDCKTNEEFLQLMKLKAFW